MTETSLLYRSSIPAPAEAVLRWHRNPGAFERLTPPWANAQVVGSSGSANPGDWKLLSVGRGPFSFEWKLVHREGIDSSGFVDVQERGPFATWRHEHRFVPDGPDRSVLEDRLSFSLPLAPAGPLVAGGAVERQLDRLFQYRHTRTRHDLARLGASMNDRPLRIAVTGSSGFVGKQLVAFLRAGGHQVTRMVRRRAEGSEELSWDPAAGRIDAGALDGMDAVVHLAGVSISEGRWSAKRKQQILQSRIEGTRLLATTLASLRMPPRVLVSASGVGYYGARTEGPVTEHAPKGSGFLSDVCEAWESETRPTQDAGIRVVNARFGVLIGAAGGLLKRVAPIFKAGLGGPLGDGRQMLSWIALDDLLAATFEAIRNERLSGPINVVAPNPVTNGEFTAAMGRALHRPAVLPAPSIALRLATGEMADELLLVSQHVVPAALNGAGFAFAFPSIESALDHELGASRWNRSSTVETMHQAYERRGAS
jgi:uncharacterized protein (TIGR01777 family)